MHKLASTPITLDCFEIDDYEEITFGIGEVQSPDMIIDYCEKLRQKYLDDLCEECDYGSIGR